MRGGRSFASQNGGRLEARRSQRRRARGFGQGTDGPHAWKTEIATRASKLRKQTVEPGLWLINRIDGIRRTLLRGAANGRSDLTAVLRSTFGRADIGA